MPCSTWTTKSPTARLRRSSRKGRAASLRPCCARVARWARRAEDLLLGDEHEALGRERPRRARAGRRRPRAVARVGSLEPRRDRTRRGAPCTRTPWCRRSVDEALDLRLGARGDEDAKPVLAPVRDAPRRADRARASCPSTARAAFTARVEVVVVVRRQIERARAPISKQLESRAGLARDRRCDAARRRRAPASSRDDLGLVA